MQILVVNCSGSNGQTAAVAAGASGQMDRVCRSSHAKDGMKSHTALRRRQAIEAAHGAATTQQNSSAQSKYAVSRCIRKLFDDPAAPDCDSDDKSSVAYYHRFRGYENMTELRAVVLRRAAVLMLGLLLCEYHSILTLVARRRVRILGQRICGPGCKSWL